MALTFWYDFSSSYSFLAALRLEDVAARAKVPVLWQPFLLGPIFKEAGYDASPNLMSPAKADYMWTDLARRAAQRGHGFVKPDPFPQRSVLAARAALSLDPAERPAFSRAVFRQAFERGKNIARTEVIAEAAAEAGFDGEALLAAAGEETQKTALFAATDKAKALGIFGAPSFVTTDGVLFWGDDRMEDALAWEKTGALPMGD